MAPLQPEHTSLPLFWTGLAELIVPGLHAVHLMSELVVPELW